MTNKHNTQKFINTEVASYFLGLSVSTLKRMRRDGDGPVFHKLGRSVKYTTIDLAEWAKANQHRVNRDTEFL